MAEAVAGLLASPLVGIVKDKLRSAIAEQASLLGNFHDDMGDMMNVLEIVSAALEDAERRSVKGKLVQLLLKRLKDVALDISDVLEDYQDMSDQATAKLEWQQKPFVGQQTSLAGGPGELSADALEKVAKIMKEVDA